MIRWRRHVRNAREAALCVRVAGSIPLIWLALRLLPLPRLLAWLTPRGVEAKGSPAGRQKAKGKGQNAKGRGRFATNLEQPPGHLHLAFCALLFAFCLRRSAPPAPARTLELADRV